MAMSAMATWWVRIPKIMVLTRIKPKDRVQRDGGRDADHRVFQHQIVQPMALERDVATFHDALALPSRGPSGFAIVVLASHSPARNTVLRLCAAKPRRSKNPTAVSLASTVSS